VLREIADDEVGTAVLAGNGRRQAQGVGRLGVIRRETLLQFIGD
jgi:hypothetical protein